jgi:hypothetical protein
MAQEIGESREAWGKDVMKKAEDFANNMKSEVKPFYIVYACKQDIPQSKKLGIGVYKQTMKAYYNRPPKLLGILVWFVNHPMGEFRFMGDLSSPPDVPVDESLLGTAKEDFLPSVAEKGASLNVLVS